MRRPRASIVVFALTAAICAPGFAQSSGKEASTTKDPPKEATGTSAESVTVRTTSRAPIPEFSSSRSVNVVDQDELQRKQAESITDGLNEEPGVFVQSTNRGAGSVFLRGLVGPANLIYFDGVRFNQSTFRTGPNQYLNTIDPWALQRMEVVRGPGSVLYGSGAMGGVIQLFPRDLPEKKLELRGLGFLEAADMTAGGSLDTGFRAGNVAFSGGATFRNHGDLRIGQRGNEDLIAPGEQDNQVPGSEFEENFFRAATGAEISDRSLVRLNYYGGYVEDATRVDRLGEGEVRLYDNRDDLLYGTYRYDGPGFVDELKWNLSYHRTYERVDRFNCATIPFDRNPNVQVSPNPRECAELDRDVLEKHRINQDTVHTVGSSLAGYSGLLDNSLSLSWGLDIYGDQVNSSRRDAEAPGFDFVEKDRGNFSDDSTYSRAGIYLRGEYNLLDFDAHDFFVNGGARLERFGAHAPDVHDEIGDVSYSFIGPVGTAGIKYLYSTNLNAYFNWSQGFRAPNLQESTVLGNTGNFFEIPNDSLGPERSNTFEIGAKLDFPMLGRLETSAYASLISDKITREEATWNGDSEIEGAPVRRRINADTAYYTGVDVSLQTAPIVGISAFGFVSAIDGAVESSNPDATFEPGPLHDLLASGENYSNPRRLPPLMYKAGLEYSPSKTWGLRFFALGAAAQTKLGPGDVDDLRICEAESGVLVSEAGGECSGTDGWLTLNLRGTYKPWEFARFDVSAENLTNKRYKYHGSGPPAPGVNGKVMMTLLTP